MVDDYGGYKALFAADIIELGCLAHARRKFFDLNAAQPNAIAQEALERIGALYAIEAEGRDLTIEARAQLRQTQAQPRLAALHAWLIATRLNVAEGSGTAKALDYSLKRWPALCRYATAGDLPIDNNPIENDIRPVAIEKRTGSSPAPSVPESGLQPFRACSTPQDSTDWIRQPGYATPSKNCRPARAARSIRSCPFAHKHYTIHRSR